MLKHNPSLEVLKANVAIAYAMRLNELRETTNPRLKTIETVSKLNFDFPHNSFHTFTFKFRAGIQQLTWTRRG